MLDHFLNAAYGRKQQADAAEKLASALAQLPDATLYAIATGKEKVAYCGSPSTFGGGDATWLDRFKGTPLFQKAFEIEQEDLQLQMQEQAARAQEQQYRDTEWTTRSTIRDSLSIQRKMLELELAAADEGMAGGTDEPPPNLPEEEEELPEEVEAPEDAAPTEPEAAPPPKKEEKELPPAAKEAAARFGQAVAALQKQAGYVGEGGASSTLRSMGGSALGGLAGVALGRRFSANPLAGAIGGGAGSLLGNVLGGQSADRANREHGRQQVLRTLRAATPATKEASDKVAFGALLRGMAGSLKAQAPALGQSLAQAGSRTVGAAQRGGLQAGLRTAGRSALTVAAKHPAAAAGAAGLGAGLLLGKASG
jgi:hypothetical protein